MDRAQNPSKKISVCRSSNSSHLISVLNLGEQYLTGVFPKSTSEVISKGPLELVWSPDAQLLQLNHSFDLNEMYGDNYGYRSGLNQSMVDHLTSKIQFLERRVSLKSGDIVIDIGSNDSTSLQAYRTQGLKRVGVDPTGMKFSSYYPEDVLLIPDFFPSPEVDEVIKDGKVKVITSIAMFYDLENPVEFAKQIEEILDDEGVWHFEQSYLPSMLRFNSYDTICHEHLEYYSLESIKYILDRANLKFLDVQMNGINGGSFAVTVAKKNSPLRPNSSLLDWLFREESKLNLSSIRPFRDFEERVYDHRESLVALLDNLRSDGKLVAGYGASTKGNVVLQFCNITSEKLSFIAEVNEFKFNRYTPGTHIPIISEEEAQKLKPDYYLVLPWHFRDSILRREKDFLARGGKFIFPFPEIEIVGG